MNFRIVGICLLALTGYGCASGDLPEYQQLGPLRVLSMKVDQPEVAAGTTVTVTPYISDLLGAGRTLTYTAQACPDPGLDRGIDTYCDQSAQKVEIESGTLTVANSPGFVAPSYTGPVKNISVTVPANLLDNNTVIEQQNGVDYLFVYQISAADGTTVKSLKRIKVSTRAQKNANPTFTSIQSAGVDLTTTPTVESTLKPNYPAASIESYTVVRNDGTTDTLTETLLTTWFISDGEIDYSRTQNDSDNKFTPPGTSPTGHSVIIVAVLRDGRGGESVIKLE